MRAIAAVVLIVLGFVLLGIGVGDRPALMAAGGVSCLVGFLLARGIRKS